MRISRFFEDIKRLFKDIKRLLAWPVWLILLILLVVGLSIWGGITLHQDFKKVTALVDFQPNTTTKIYDKNGVLISEIFRQKRELITYDQIPDEMIQAIVAVEDNEFFDHHGINPRGIMRAFFINLAAGGIRQGGSTITQQLAKVLLTSRKRSITRKVKEAFIALMIDQHYSKEKILEMYLNQIFLGQGNYGIESAAQFYFSKPTKNLNLAECALIATLPSSPNRRSPIRYPKRAMINQRNALASMVDLGYITINQAEKAYLEFWPQYLEFINELPPSYNANSLRINKAPWVTEYIRRTISKKYGEKALYTDGLKIYTTFDIKKQMAAQETLKNALERQTAISASLAFKNEDYFSEKFTDSLNMFYSLFDLNDFRKTGSLIKKQVNEQLQKETIDELELLNLLYGSDNITKFISSYKKSYTDEKYFQQVEGCIITINHTNGYIETMVGGSEFTSFNQLNRIFQSRRQPGSVIKPLLYTAAIESRKFTTASTILDSPVIYMNAEDGDWTPENYAGSYYGLLRLRTALEKSINVISIRIAERLGVQTVIDYYAKLLKFSPDETKKRIPRNYSIALGSTEVEPFEIARAYAIIANGGKEVIPYTIRYVEDRDGNIIYNPEKEIKEKLKEKEENGTIQIIEPETAQIMISLLRSAVETGTGGAARIDGCPTGGKTGTTNNFRDGWFCGFTPKYATALWIGYDKLGLSLGQGQSGGHVAAPVWGEYMRKAVADEPAGNFPHYADLTTVRICSKSGMLPGPYCRHTINEIFIPGTEPRLVPLNEIQTEKSVLETNESIIEKTKKDSNVADSTNAKIEDEKAKQESPSSNQTCNICRPGTDYDTSIKGPRSNISNDAKTDIIKNIKSDDEEDILNSLGNDILQ